MKTRWRIFFKIRFRSISGPKGLTEHVLISSHYSQLGKWPFRLTAQYCRHIWYIICIPRCFCRWGDIHRSASPWTSVRWTTVHTMANRVNETETWEAAHWSYKIEIYGRTQHSRRNVSFFLLLLLLILLLLLLLLPLIIIIIIIIIIAGVVPRKMQNYETTDYGNRRKSRRWRRRWLWLVRKIVLLNSRSTSNSLRHLPVISTAVLHCPRTMTRSFFAVTSRNAIISNKRQISPRLFHKQVNQT